MTKFAGFHNLGRPRFPPRPSFILMQDRADGEYKLLTHLVGLSSWEVSETLPSGLFRHEIRRYGPFDGPYINTTPLIRLYLSSGTLTYEEAPEQSYIHHPRVLTRRGGTRNVGEVYVPASFRLGDALSFRIISP